MSDIIEVLDKEKYANIYIPQANQTPKLESLFMRDDDQILSFGVFYGGVDDPQDNIEVTVDFAINMVANFNAEHGTEYEPMPEGSYSLENNTALITSGQPNSSLLKIKIKTIGYIDGFKPYLLPVQIKSVSNGSNLHPQKSVVYFLIAGSFEPGNIPADQVFELQDNDVRSIFDYHGNIMTQSASGIIRLYPYLDDLQSFGSGTIINTGWDVFDLVLPFLDRWIVRWGSWTGGNNGFLNSYPVSHDGAISPAVPGWYGGGFEVFDLIIPYQGSLLCRFPSGIMNRYPISPTYLFGGMTTLSVDGWQSYKQIIPYKNTLLCIDEIGDLWEFPVTADGIVSPRRRVGSGWDMYKKIVAFGDDLLAIDNENKVFKYKFNPIGFWALK